MSSNRDSLFPSSGGLGRVQGSTVASRPVSPSSSLREPLATHPLLFPSPSTSIVIPSSDSSANAYPTTTRYTPYTPRHRGASPASPATIGPANLSPLSVSLQQHHGDTATKVYVVNMKATAQKLGLESDSLGWIILEKLANEADQNPEWDEIWAALTTGQATLLLPLEQSSETISIESIKSHIVFCDEPLIPLPPNGSSVPVMTLSGVMGTLSEDALIVRSTLHHSSKVFQKILVPATRFSAFSSLPSLHATSYNYPTFKIGAPSSTISHISFPPRTSFSSKPSLPPRPGSARQTSSAIQSPSSRIPNPFASFFSPKPLATSPAPSALPVSLPSALHSEPPEVLGHPIGVSVCTIDKGLHLQTLAKSINGGLREEVKASLLLSKENTMPGWVVDMVVDWIEASFFPFSKTEQNGSETFVVTQFAFEADEISQIVQDFYANVTDAVVAKSKKHQRKDASDDSGGIHTADEEMDSSAEKEMTAVDVNEDAKQRGAKSRELMDRIEGTICNVLYDRFFMPSTSDDGSHDEALSSRIAALNMLDLSLDHLGVEVEAIARDDMRAVVEVCGETLFQLNSPNCRCPADKSALLVKAHKLLVDELSKLPPVRLRGDDQEKPIVSHDDKNSRGVHTEEKEMESMSSDKRASLDEDETRTDTPPIVVSSDSGQVLPSDGGTSSLTKSTSEPTPVSGDVILPLMIFSVVKSNPPHLLSHLFYIQRLRNQTAGGEESYCLINLMAVAEFLEHVDLAHLGLGVADDRSVNTSQLSPISVTRSRGIASVVGSPTTIGTTELKAENTERLRGRVEQQVDAIAGSANKVLSGVVNSSFGVLRSFLPGNTEQGADGLTTDVILQDPLRPSGVSKKESVFSIAGLTASLPGARAKSSGQQLVVPGDGESGQQMIEVSTKPALRVGDDEKESPSNDSAESSEEELSDEVDENHDAKSIRSFESMMSSTKRRRHRSTPGSRKSIADRLASVPGLGRLSSSYDSKELSSMSKPSSLLLPPANINRFDSPMSSRPPTPISLRISPPIQRFLECDDDDLRISEVRTLLGDYRRIVEAVRAMGAFQE